MEVGTPWDLHPFCIMQQMIFEAWRYSGSPTEAGPPRDLHPFFKTWRSGGSPTEEGPPRDLHQFCIVKPLVWEEWQSGGGPAEAGPPHNLTSIRFANKANSV